MRYRSLFPASLISLAGLLGCGNDLHRHTRAFVAPTACGQGPYEITFLADGTTGGDGVEVIACTPRRISGHVVFSAGQLELANQSYGDGSDNQRCFGGPSAIVASSGGGSGTSSAGATGVGDASSAAPVLIERPFTSSETPFSDKLCETYGLTAQVVLMPTILTRTSTEYDFLPRGSKLRVRLWSDAPNDLEGVVFMVRQLTSTQTPAQVAKEESKRDKSHDKMRSATPSPDPADHGPPPAPLDEERPPQPIAAATWIPGYWTWATGQWGWRAGFWRDERYAPPPPRVEQPGAPPGEGAIWIGGTWTLRATGYGWVSGRWRR